MKRKITSENFQLRRSSRLKKISENSEIFVSENSETNCVLQKLEDIKKQEKVPLNVKKKLKELHIKLIHKVPPQHKIEFTATHGLTKEQTKQFQNYGPLLKGPYSSEEDKIIKNNWNTFCELYDWDSTNVKPFLAWRHEKDIEEKQLNYLYYINIKERKKFVKFLANGLPWRPLFSVYRRFKRLYRNKLVNIRYTKDEDEVILMYIHNEHLNKRKNKYTELAKLLKRTTQSIAKRYQYLKRTADKSTKSAYINPSVNVKSRMPMIKKKAIKTYIKTLLDVTLSEDINDLKFAILPKLVWQEMEKKLKIDQNILKTFWQHQLHMQLFSTRPIYLNDIRIQLIEYMYVKGISNIREIIWPKVASHFDGATPIFLCKIFCYLVQQYRRSRKHIDENFVDIMEYLYNTKIDAIKNASHDVFLSRILYKDDKLVMLDEENSNATIADIDKYDETCDTDDSGDKNNS